jgi:TIGR03009 family protein
MPRRIRHLRRAFWAGLAQLLPALALAQAPFPSASGNGTPPAASADGVARTRPAVGQPAGTAAQGQAGANPNAGAVLSGQPQSAAIVVQTPREVIKILEDWEQCTQGIERLRGSFDRYIYDATFCAERRAIGDFWFQKPDLGRIDLRPAPPERLPEPNEDGERINPRKTGANGLPYTVQADAASRWICNGQVLLQVDDEAKTYVAMDIPPSMQGANISNSPLPFLFGMSAAEMQRRYVLALGEKHNPTGANNTRPQIHLVAYPKLERDASEWCRAEVLLDPGIAFQIGGKPIYVPTAIKLLDPTKTRETVYVFVTNTMRLNEGPLMFKNPFREPGLLSGYKLIEHYRQATRPEDEERTAEQPEATSQTESRGLFR